MAWCIFDNIHWFHFIITSLALSSNSNSGVCYCCCNTCHYLFFFFYLFNRFAWKLSVFSIPDISGGWEVTGQTLNEDGTDRYRWNAEIDIEQTWEKICITMKTSQSESESYTATLGKRSGTKAGWILHYSYSNNPNADQFHELQSHKGYCELIFNKDLTQGTAAYFNSNGRRTFGQMTLARLS
ncbi:pancortin-3 [Enterobacter mori]|uniref:Cap15 family cyclic dinucleotide receptor domain-containing protein n=1 Tax=Enterobacter mori TaxID=539813 RepID=UPI003A0FD5FE